MKPQLPDDVIKACKSTASPFDAENAFYLTAGPERLGKLVAQVDLFRRTLEVPGEIVECGVFKGASFARWATLRELFCLPQAKRLIGFDTFGTYFQADTARDQGLRQNVVDGAGDACVTAADLHRALGAKGCGRNVELVAGDICKTVPRYVRDHPELRISLLNVDVDFRAATETILRELWPRVARGGVMVLDDYATFQGETEAVEEMLPGALVKRFPFAYSPCYLVKGDA